MKRHKNRSGQKKRLFQAVVRAWNAGQRQSLPFAALAFMGLGARAEEDLVMPEVVVTGEQRKMSSPKYTAPVRNIPQTVTIIPTEVIEKQGATNLRDVLRNVPGISIQAGEGGVPLGDNLTIRGFAARTDIFVDGVRDIGGYTRDPFAVEQVEVVKGPGSTNAGRGSTGGSVNMSSKSPRMNAFRRLSAGVGTDEYNRYTLDVNQPLNEKQGVALRVNALYHTTGIVDRDPAKDERWGVAPSLALGLGTPARATLSYLHVDQHNLPDYGIPWVPETNTTPELIPYRGQVPPVSYENYYGITARDGEDVKTDVATLVLEKDLGSQYTLRNLTRYGQTDRLSIVTSPRFVSTSTTTLTRQLQDRDQVDSILANQTDVTMRLGQASLRHTIVAGVEFANENSTRHRLTGPATPNADLYYPNPSDPYTGPITRSGARQEGEAESYGIYGFDTVAVGDRWEFPLGLRWDSVKLNYDDRLADGTVTKTSRKDEMPSWRAGAVYKVTPFGSVYAGAGTSFNPVSEGLLLSTVTTNAANANLDPEETRSFELGTKWDILNGGLSLAAAIFRTEKINARTRDPGVPTEILVLEGEQRVDGVEFGVTGNLTDKWAMFAAATFLNSEILSSRDPLEQGKELANTPDRSFSLWTTYALPFRLEAGAGVQYVGDRFSSNQNLRKAPAYTLFDGMLAWAINTQLGLRLNVNNITDLEDPDRVGGGHVVPGEGRKFTLTADARF